MRGDLSDVFVLRNPFDALKYAVLQVASRREVKDGFERYCWCPVDWADQGRPHLESCRRIRAAYYQDPGLLEKEARGGN